MRPRLMFWPIVLTLVVLMLPGCAGPSDDGGDSTPTTDAVVVVGSAGCVMASYSDESVDGVLVIDEHFVCEHEMSDPRVNGTEDLRVVTRLANRTTGGAWTVQEAVLTNDMGTWRGSAQGVVDLAGVHPFADGVAPFNYGEVLYIGEGGYEGLEYQYYFSGSNGQVGVTGWIQPAD